MDSASDQTDCALVPLSLNSESCLPRMADRGVLGQAGLVEGVLRRPGAAIVALPSKPTSGGSPLGPCGADGAVAGAALLFAGGGSE